MMPRIPTPPSERARVDVGRRRLLKRAAAIVAATPFAGDLSRLALAAGPFTDYRALVCVFLYGGNDAHNTVVPVDAAYANYQAQRGNLALPTASLIGVGSGGITGRSFGFNGNLPRLAALFAGGRAAVVANVGALLRPTTKADYQAGRMLPPQLFSHSDLQNHWQTARPADPVGPGWGGGLAEIVASANGASPLSVAISVAGNNVFMRSDAMAPYFLSPDPVSATENNLLIRAYRYWDDWAAGRPFPQRVFEDQLVLPRTHLLEAEWADTMARAQDTAGYLWEILRSAPPLATVFPGTAASDNPKNRLAMELKQVARVIGAFAQNVATLGVRRQVFFVSLGGFDNHGDQLAQHGPLLKSVDDALGAFYDASVELGVAANVTTFTGSDFGRTLASNGRGSDHGWGGHHFVVGGAVAGNRVYGQFPDLVKGGPTDVGQGRLLPTLSVDEYGATLGRGFGVGATELPIVFPGLGNFASSNLGFLG